VKLFKNLPVGVYEGNIGVDFKGCHSKTNPKSKIKD
jgi:hypothetical protein